MSELRERFDQAMREEAEVRADSLPEADVFGGGVLDEAVEETVEDRFAWVLPDLADTTRDWIQKDIVDGLDEGRNPRRVAQDLRKRFDDDFATWRAERIARTEMLTASNAGTHATHQSADVVDWRSWLATGPPTFPGVRPAHITLHEQTVKVNEPFEVQGETAMYPGDFALARLSVNCRCTTVAEFPDRQDRTPAERQKIWKAFDQRLEEQDKQTAKVVARAFARQRDKVLGVFQDVFDLNEAA